MCVLWVYGQPLQNLACNSDFLLQKRHGIDLILGSYEFTLSIEFSTSFLNLAQMLLFSKANGLINLENYHFFCYLGSSGTMLDGKSTISYAPSIY